MNKRALVHQILSHLARELELYDKSARAAHEEATHEQSKAENKYDTRGLEASYLARGQSRQAAETAQAWQQFDALVVRDFTAADPIDVGALVEVQEEGDRQSLYFIGARAGGLEIEHEGQTVLVMTPQSPLGRQLMGRRKGEHWEIEIGGSKREYRVTNVR